MSVSRGTCQSRQPWQLELHGFPESWRPGGPAATQSEGSGCGGCSCASGEAGSTCLSALLRLSALCRSRRPCCRRRSMSPDSTPALRPRSPLSSEPSGRAPARFLFCPGPAAAHDHGRQTAVTGPWLGVSNALLWMFPISERCVGVGGWVSDHVQNLGRECARNLVLS